MINISFSPPVTGFFCIIYPANSGSSQSNGTVCFLPKQRRQGVWTTNLTMRVGRTHAVIQSLNYTIQPYRVCPLILENCIKTTTAFHTSPR